MFERVDCGLLSGHGGGDSPDDPAFIQGGSILFNVFDKSWRALVSPTAQTLDLNSQFEAFSGHHRRVRPSKVKAPASNGVESVLSLIAGYAVCAHQER